MFRYFRIQTQPERLHAGLLQTCRPSREFRDLEICMSTPDNSNERCCSANLTAASHRMRSSIFDDLLYTQFVRTYGMLCAHKLWRYINCAINTWIVKFCHYLVRFVSSCNIYICMYTQISVFCVHQFNLFIRTTMQKVCRMWSQIDERIRASERR